MSRELNISTGTMSQIITDDVMKDYHWSVGHRLDARLKNIRNKRAKRLLQWQAANGHENILFTDEQIFTVEEKFNKQCDKINAHSSAEAKERAPRVQRGHHAASMMVECTVPPFLSQGS